MRKPFKAWFDSMDFPSPEQLQMIYDYNDFNSGTYILTRRMLNKLAAKILVGSAIS